LRAENRKKSEYEIAKHVFRNRNSLIDDISDGLIPKPKKKNSRQTV